MQLNKEFDKWFVEFKGKMTKALLEGKEAEDIEYDPAKMELVAELLYGGTRMNARAEPFEGQDILNLLERMDNGDDDCSELTKGRIRSIYVKLKYGGERYASNLAEYYDLPIELIKDIGRGKVFKNITKDLEDE